MYMYVRTVCRTAYVLYVRCTVNIFCSLTKAVLMSTMLLLLNMSRDGGLRHSSKNCPMLLLGEHSEANAGFCVYACA